MSAVQQEAWDLARPLACRAMAGTDPSIDAVGNFDENRLGFDEESGSNRDSEVDGLRSDVAIRAVCRLERCLPAVH